MKNRLDCAIHVLEHDALGTCKSYYEVDHMIVERVADIYGLKITTDEADVLLGQAMAETGIFLCQSCSWWCEPCDLSLNLISYDTCRDCEEDDEDE